MRNRREQLGLLLGERKRSVVALAILSIFSGLVEASILAVIAQVASALVRGSTHLHASIGHVDVNASIPTMIEIAFVLTTVRLIIQIPLSTIPARIGSEVQSSLRLRLFDAYTRASWGQQSKDLEGHLQETITNQISQATSGALQTTSLITSAFSFIVLMGAAFALNPVAALVVGVTSTAMFAALRPMRGMGVRSARALSRAQVSFARAVAEATRVAQEVNVFGVGDVQRERIDVFVQKAKQRFFRTQVLSRMVGNIYQSLIYILLVAGLAGLYLTGRNHAGQLGGVILVLLRAATAGQLAQGNYQGIAQAVPFIERASEAIDRYEESAETDGGQPLERVETVGFDHVSFSYNAGRPVLSDITFEVQQGEVIGIIGPSGAGKSTLVQLLLRLRQPASGAYLVNGRPASDFSREDWHRQVSYVPQEPRLLHASVADNIRFFREIPDDEVEKSGEARADPRGHRGLARGL